MTDAMIIGYRWRGWDGGIYLCVRFEQQRDYVMRLLEKPSDYDGTRAVGDEIGVSPRVFYRTYYHAPGPSGVGVAHDARCECMPCRMSTAATRDRS